MAQPNATISKVVSSLGGTPATRDGVTMFVLNPPTAYTTTGTLIFNSLKSAEDAGITEAKDLANDVLVWEHIKDFYAQVEGEELHVLFVAETCTFTNLFTSANANNILLKNYLASKQGVIKMLGVSLKPTTETNTGLSVDLITAISVAQVVADYEYSKARPLDIVMEGRKLTGTALATQNLRNLASGNVSVFVGRDATRKAELTTAGNSGADNYAAIGLLLGRLANSHVGRNVGRVKDPAFNIVPEFSGGQKPLGTVAGDFSEIDLDTLNDKGYIYFKTFARKVGGFINDDHTCALAMLTNAYMRYNRSLNKASRIAIDTYVNELLDDLAVDADTGGLRNADVKRIENGLREAIVNEMITNLDPTRVAEISAVTVKMDSTVGILASEKITVRLSIVPLGNAKEIETVVQLINPAQQ